MTPQTITITRTITLHELAVSEPRPSRLQELQRRYPMWYRPVVAAKRALLPPPFTPIQIVELYTEINICGICDAPGCPSQQKRVIIRSPAGFKVQR